MKTNHCTWCGWVRPMVDMNLPLEITVESLVLFICCPLVVSIDTKKCCMESRYSEPTAAKERPLAVICGKGPNWRSQCCHRGTTDSYIFLNCLSGMCALNTHSIRLLSVPALLRCLLCVRETKMFPVQYRIIHGRCSLAAIDKTDLSGGSSMWLCPKDMQVCITQFMHLYTESGLSTCAANRPMYSSNNKHAQWPI